MAQRTFNDIDEIIITRALEYYEAKILENKANLVVNTSDSETILEYYNKRLSEISGVKKILTQ